MHDCDILCGISKVSFKYIIYTFKAVYFIQKSIYELQDPIDIRIRNGDSVSVMD